ncbi:MAG TPA: ATP-binding protein, partial [Acidobacteriaceae bacterium]
QEQVTPGPQLAGLRDLIGRGGVRTSLLLVLVVTLMTVIVTGLCLLLIRSRLLSDVRANLSQDLAHSFASFEDMQAERMAALDRENTLLANLPTLKALMTSRDDLTIQDGAVEFWNISGADLFALADSNGRIVASYARGGATPSVSMQQGLTTLLAHPGLHYLIDANALYACSLRPLYFGSAETGTLLGYVISGAAIERTVRQISHAAGVDAAFFSNGHIVASTLDATALVGLTVQPQLLSGTSAAPATIHSGTIRHLAAVEDLSSASTAPLQLVVLKSFAPAENSIRRIDRMILSVGLFALVCGAALMFTLSHLLTSPLEELARSVRAFATGDGSHQLPHSGTREVLELSAAFSSMRDEIKRANHALLESERLATIGRMASSISHDFRHYLASIYANAEFLLSSRMPEKERAEVFEEIRSAVLGSTEMIESLLIFSRTGKITRSPESVAKLMERAVTLVRVHPDGEGVRIAVRSADSGEALAMVDSKQIERAIFNLLLNACQAARIFAKSPRVLAVLETGEDQVILTVTDNGSGVPQNVRNRLFDPFVSEGKQKGTGLGLTLVACIATDHGGEVRLISSKPGETVFRMRIVRSLPKTSLPIAETCNIDPIPSSVSHESLQA